MGGSDFAYAGMEYLTKQRGLTEETIETREIGICPPDATLPSQIQTLGDEEREWSNYSRHILGRIIVPIHDEFGHIVGFATRSIYPDGTTWWNTPFPKSKHLFLLGKSKKSVFESGKIYLVEGYMDAILLQQCGITNAVAVMGTNLSLRQIGLIVRYCHSVCCCYDTDNNFSGQKAQIKTMMALNRFKVIFEDLSVISGIESGVDPDEFVLKNGKDAFLEKEKILEPKDFKKMERVLKKIKEDAKSLKVATL